MTESPERSAVRNAYRGRAWVTKVNKMSDQQVYAVYRSLKAQNKI